MNVKTAIAASLLTLSIAVAAHAMDRYDTGPRPGAYPEYPSETGNGMHQRAPVTQSGSPGFDQRMRATGSGFDYCQQALYPLEPSSGRNVLGGTC